MTTPEERELQKYRWRKFERQWKIMNRISFWAPIVVFFGGALLFAWFGK